MTVWATLREEREVLQQAIQLDPTLAAAHNQLGFLSLQAGQDADAERELKAAIALDPQYAEAQGNLGVLYGQQGKNNQAEQLFRQATENDPQYAQAFVNLGLVLAANRASRRRNRRCGARSRSARTMPRPLACWPWYWPA